MFCFEYYHMVRIIKYVHDDIPVPPEIKKCDRIQYWVWIILCIISTIAFAVFVRIEYWKTLHSEIVLPFLFICSNYYFNISGHNSHNEQLFDVCYIQNKKNDQRVQRKK